MEAIAPPDRPGSLAHVPRLVISTLPSSISWRGRSFCSALISNRCAEGEMSPGTAAGWANHQGRLGMPASAPVPCPRMPQDDAELHGLALGVPARVFWEAEEHDGLWE